MHKVVVSFAPLTSAMIPGEEYMRGVADAFRAVREQKTKIFRTYLRGSECFTFVTTEEKLDNDLGCLSFAGQYYLAKLLEQEFQREKCNTLLFSVEDRKGIVLVTMTSTGSEVTFTLSSAQ
ncbi:MAG: hypothetical protein ACYC1Y_02025 [Minisyncoccota bacterium]